MREERWGGKGRREELDGLLLRLPRSHRSRLAHRADDLAVFLGVAARAKRGEVAVSFGKKEKGVKGNRNGATHPLLRSMQRPTPQAKKPGSEVEYAEHADENGDDGAWQTKPEEREGRKGGSEREGKSGRGEREQELTRNLPEEADPPVRIVPVWGDTIGEDANVLRKRKRKRVGARKRKAEW